MPKDNKLPKNIHLILGEGASTKVRNLIQRLEVEGSADVVRAGLSLLVWYLDKRAEGYEIQLVKDGVVYQVEISNLID